MTNCAVYIQTTSDDLEARDSTVVRGIGIEQLSVIAIYFHCRIRKEAGFAPFSTLRQGNMILPSYCLLCLQYNIVYVNCVLCP